MIATWPDSAKASDAMLNIASSQAEAGDVNGSRNTLRTLVSKYPNSPGRRAGEAAPREEVAPR